MYYYHSIINTSAGSDTKGRYVSGSFLPLPDPLMIEWRAFPGEFYPAAYYAMSWQSESGGSFVTMSDTPWKESDRHTSLWPLSTIGHMVLCLTEEQWEEAREWAKSTYREIILRKMPEEYWDLTCLQKALINAAFELDLSCFLEQVKVLRSRKDTPAHVYERLLYLGVV